MGFLSGVTKSLKDLGSNIGESLGFKGHDKIGNTVGQWMNNFTGASDMYNKEYAGNVALWKMQNEYNTPSAQIARMKAAGIDVNPMTYALGNGSMSTSAGNISAPSVGASGVNPIASLISVLSGIKDIKLARQQELNMKAVESSVLSKEYSDAMTTAMTLENMDLQNVALRHNIAWARSHGVPLNQMPGIESSATSFVNEVLTGVGRGRLYNDVYSELSGKDKIKRAVNIILGHKRRK